MWNVVELFLLLFSFFFQRLTHSFVTIIFYMENADF